MELNQKQVSAWLKIALASGGPLYVWILAHTGITDSEYQMDVNLAAYILPPLIVAAFAWISNRLSSQISNVAKSAPDKLGEALGKVPDAVKIQAAETASTVATVVTKDNSNGKVGELAADPNHPKVVSETQNEADAKKGTKTP